MVGHIMHVSYESNIYLNLILENIISFFYWNLSGEILYYLLLGKCLTLKLL